MKESSILYFSSWEQDNPVMLEKKKSNFLNIASEVGIFFSPNKNV